MDKQRVLIVCADNPGRNEIAEGFILHEAGSQFEVFSAATDPPPVCEEAIAVMKEFGLNISSLSASPLTSFAGQDFDFVITLCDRIRFCTAFPEGARRLHWSLDDAAQLSELPHQRVEAFRRLRDRIHSRVMFFIGEKESGGEFR
jgi:arsenate reductase